MKILPAERKFVKMVGLMDKIVSNDLTNTIDKMIKKDPRLLCRLNFSNPQVKEILKKKIAAGELHPFDLLHHPEDTFNLSGVSRTQYERSVELTPEDALWLEDLTDRFDRMTRKQARALQQKRKAIV